jgi:hypothetical protein
LDEAERGSQESDHDQEGSDVLKRFGPEPIKDLSSVIKCQHSLRSESNQARDGEPKEESVGIYLQCASGKDEGCERKGGRD